MFETLFNLFRSVENIMNRRLTRIRRRFVHRVSIERNYCNQKILKATSLRNDAWNVGCDAAHVEIGYVVPPQCKNNIFWIFETATSRNYGKWMATCGMSVSDKFRNMSIISKKRLLWFSGERFGPIVVRKFTDRLFATIVIMWGTVKVMNIKYRGSL